MAAKRKKAQASRVLNSSIADESKDAASKKDSDKGQSDEEVEIDVGEIALSGDAGAK